jgi:hypothetical protein
MQIKVIMRMKCILDRLLNCCVTSSALLEETLLKFCELGFSRLLLEVTLHLAKNAAALIANACMGTNQSNYEDEINLWSTAAFSQSLQVSCLRKSLGNFVN